jgi:hypothetical protein
MSQLPDLQVNAWLGGVREGARAERDPDLLDWAIRESGVLPPEKVLFAEEPPDLTDWTQAGWGVVLPDSDDLDDNERIEATDAPQPIRDLLDHRSGSPVLRYRPEWGTAYFLLCERGSKPRKIKTAGGEKGADARQMPHYLLIVGSPEEIPWWVQYVLNLTHYVGRLDLDDAGLRNYVNALMGDWSGFVASRRTAVTWAVDWGESDITWLMRHGLAEKLAAKYEGDKDIDTSLHLPKDQATHARLLEALEVHHPGVIVTTSHGSTPVHQSDEQVRADLGRLVDQEGALLSAELIADWKPEGAIWYAHACCSAGSDSPTVYDQVARPGSDVDRVLKGVAEKAGAGTAPLPQQLLGGDRPLRAFVGHVEPTFNWTLRDPENGQPLTSGLVSALYHGLYQKKSQPIGYALASHYEAVADLWAQWYGDSGELERFPSALSCRLEALDRQSTVVLGDPTVALP